MRFARRAAGILVLAAVPAASALSSVPAAAQDGGAVTGRVVASVSGEPIAGALVSLPGTADTTTTSASGLFRFEDLAYGAHVLHVEYLGMRSRDVPFRVAPRRPTDLSVALELAVIPVAGLLVRIRRDLPVSKLFGFFRRMEHGHGYFITREDVERRHPARPTDLLRRVPGLDIGPSRHGVAQVTMGRRTGCVPEYYVDGARAPYFVIDDLQPADLAGIEIYRGNSEVPIEFKARARCGAIIIWTRDPGDWR